MHTKYYNIQYTLLPGNYIIKKVIFNECKTWLSIIVCKFTKILNQFFNFSKFVIFLFYSCERKDSSLKGWNLCILQYNKIYIII